VLTVRPVTATDVDGLVALDDDLSDDDRYRQFFSGFRPPRSFFERHRIAACGPPAPAPEGTLRS
jgi:hypothetical protein